MRNTVGKGFFKNKIKELEEEQIRTKKKELLNIDRKMLEKKQEFKRYSDFREKFSDVFKELDFEDTSKK